MVKKKFPLIAFCGTDGSGKTTWAKKVNSFLKDRGIESTLNHAHAYSTSQDSFGLSEEMVRKLRYLFRFFIPFAFADNIKTFLFQYNPIRKKRILICDRYFYDKLARMIYYGICGKSLAKLYLKLLPKPDIVFFLDIDPQSAWQRKQEYKENEYKDFQDIYTFIADYLKAPLINTAADIEVSWKRIHSFLKANNFV